MQVINAIKKYDKLQLFHPGGSSTFVPAVYDYYIPRIDGHPARGFSLEGNWWRIKCSSWQDRQNQLKLWNHYEGDVNPLRRYFVDHPEVTIAKPNACYLDLETDSRATFAQVTAGKARVLCWTIQGKTDGKVTHGVLKADTDQDERKLFQDLWATVARLGYEQILAWNGGAVEWDILDSEKSQHGFDFYVLIRRSQRLGCLPVWWKRILYLDHLACFKRNHMNSGESGDEKQSYSLEAIGQALLGRGKEEIDKNKIWEEWAAGGTRRDKLSSYNIADVQLEADIEKESGYLEVFQSLCEISWVFPETLNLQPSRQVDGMMLKYGKDLGVHFPTKVKRDGSKKEKYPGSFNDGPYVRGIARNIHVADFKALYPSIMVSLNISPETLGKPGSKCPLSDATYGTSSIGVLPFCVKEAQRLREYWKQRAKQYPKGSPEERDAARKSMAYKVAINSMYGVMGNPHSRFFSVELAKSITLTGQALIKSAQGECIKRGWKVIYIDTDSVFVEGPTSNEEFKAFTDWANKELFPKLATEWGCRENNFYLDYEKAFSKVLFSFDPHKQRYTRKRYCYRLAHKGFTPPQPGSEVDVVGIEYKRGDGSRLARQLQRLVVSMMMESTDPDPDKLIETIEEYRLKLYHTDLPLEDVVISKSVSKPLEEYDGSLPHVNAAKIMQERGMEVREGTKIRYVVVKGSKITPGYDGQQVILADDYKGELDRDWLWETSVYPPTHRIIKTAFPGDGRFDQFCMPVGKAVKYARAERAGQLRLPI